jgi:hypothetical protein
VAGRCRWVGAVQGVQLRRGHRTGRRPGEAPTAAAASSSLLGSWSSSSPLSSTGAVTAEGKIGASRV